MVFTPGGPVKPKGVTTPQHDTRHAPCATKAFQPHWLFGLVLALVGGALASTLTTSLSMVIVAAAFVFSACAKGTKGALVASVCAVVATTVCLSFDLVLMAEAYASVVVALVVGWLVWKNRLSTSSALIVVGCLTLVHLVCELIQAHITGQDFSQQILATFNEVQASVTNPSVDEVYQLKVARDTLVTLWPMTFVVVGMVEYVLCLWGARFGRSLAGTRAEKPSRFVEFDLPLWAVGLGLVLAAAYAVVLTVPEIQTPEILMVSANVIATLRLAVAVQGFAVVYALTKRTSRLFLVVGVSAAALMLEADFFVLTLVGLVDVWTDLRHLGRGSSLPFSQTTQQNH